MPFFLFLLPLILFFFYKALREKKNVKFSANGGRKETEKKKKNQFFRSERKKKRETMSEQKEQHQDQEQERLDLENRLAVLNEEIARREREIKDIESGKLDSEIPRLYTEIFKSEEKEEPGGAAAVEADAGNYNDNDDDTLKNNEESEEKDEVDKKPPKEDDEHEEQEPEEDEETEKEEKLPLKIPIKTEQEDTPIETNESDDGDDNSNEQKVKIEKDNTKKVEPVKPQVKPTGQHRGRPRLNKSTSPNIAAAAAMAAVAAEGLTQAEIDQRIAGLNAMKKNMEEIIRLTLRKDSGFFDHAVTKEEAPDYCDTIKHRIDLSFLQRRVQRGRYLWPACKTQAEAGALFSRDLMLMFANAFIFNAPGSEICEIAEVLKTSCIKHLKEYNMWPVVIDQPPKAPTKSGLIEPSSSSLKRGNEEKFQDSEMPESDGNENTAEEVEVSAPITKRRKRSHR